MLARLINTQEEGSPPMVECEARVNEIIHYIHENYNSSISLENLSKEFFVSKSRLSQIFKDATGFSIGDYIITYRIKRACSFLQSGMRVQDVSEAVGFRTSTHFIRTFKKRMNCSPGEFAKNSE
ncbi:HTH-type transcriptional regulator YesS [bioreactor metagenome]|uniref:HTH-type transcriptional regulator YesS n=1 Tax=bioreactor metagenome TaxID=1076179 RepID=A0A645GY71_9ZZZZ